MSTAYAQSANAATRSFSPFTTLQALRQAAGVAAPTSPYIRLGGQRAAYSAPVEAPRRMGLFKKVLIGLAGLWAFKKLLAKMRASSARKTENLDLFA